MPRTPLFSECQAKVHHQRRAGEGDEQAQASKNASVHLRLLDLGVHVLALRFAQCNARSARKGLQRSAHLGRNFACSVKLGLAFARSRQTDDIDALPAEERSQVGDRSEKRRPEGVRARAFGLRNACHAELDRLVGTDDDAKPVTSSCLQAPANEADTSTWSLARSRPSVLFPSVST